LLKGSRVLDVGCGTSILSCFAARAGAAVVVGLDGSAAIAGLAKQVIKQLGEDGQRTCSKASVIKALVIRVSVDLV
jgi:predicted RNA methylase